MADSYPRIDSDRDQLINNENSSNRRWLKCGHPRLGLFLAIIGLIVLGHGLAIYFIYFRCSSYNCVGLKVIALNTWGMPATFGSEYKPERMEAIADQVSKGDYDIFLLEELWLQPDHETIAAKIPKDYMMTGFRQLSLATCDGRATPLGCR